MNELPKFLDKTVRYLSLVLAWLIIIATVKCAIKDRLSVLNANPVADQESRRRAAQTLAEGREIFKNQVQKEPANTLFEEDR